jgi:hypothetical protein
MIEGGNIKSVVMCKVGCKKGQIEYNFKALKVVKIVFKGKVNQNIVI